MIFIDGQLAKNKPMANSTKPTTNSELELMLMKGPAGLRNGGSGANKTDNQSNRTQSAANNIATSMLAVPGVNNAQSPYSNSAANMSNSTISSRSLLPGAGHHNFAHQQPDTASREDEVSVVEYEGETMDTAEENELVNESLNGTGARHRRANHSGQELALTLNPDQLEGNEVFSLEVPRGYGIGQISSFSPQMNGALDASGSSLNGSGDKLDTATADVIISEYPAECFPDHMYNYCLCCLEETPFWAKWKEIRLKCYQFVEHKYFETLVITLILISSMALVRTFSLSFPLTTHHFPLA